MDGAEYAAPKKPQEKVYEEVQEVETIEETKAHHIYPEDYKLPVNPEITIGEKDFLTSYRSMISLLRSANPDMKIILFTPCYGLSEYSVYTLENFINPLISSVAEELGCPVFDMFSYTREMFTEADFSDGVHPLDSGYSIVAEKVAEIVRQYQ